MPSPRYWREVPARYRLEGVRCAGCGKVVFPARAVCPDCRGETFEPASLSRRGTVVTSTVVHVAPDEFSSEAPYAMAIVETPEGARLMAQVVDCDPATVLPGLEVALEFRKIRREGHGGILCYGHKGVPVTRGADGG
jgi:uncharacterized OB-fold protein